MSQVQSILNALLIRASTDLDPAMVSVLQEIVNELDRLGLIVDPAPVVPTKISIQARLIPTLVDSFTYTFTRRNVILDWIPASFDFVFYEIRKGTNWDTASRVLVTSNLQAIIDPLTVGTHTFLIKTLSSRGIYSEDYDSLIITVPDLGTPVITPTILDQNVLLRWTEPSSTFDIDHYEITRNDLAFSTARSNFSVIIETAGGNYVYGVKAVDIAGNIGPEGITNILLTSPADFILYASQIDDLSGTKNNSVLQDGRLLLPINITETYEEHFIDNLWDSPQEQIDAGYPRWLSPSTEIAYYEQVFDFGVIFTNVIVSLQWAFEIIEGEFTFGIEAEVSDDGSSYTGAYNTQNFFVTSLRYLRVRVNFTGSDDKALMWFFNFGVSLSVKEEMDSGTVIADEDDIDGTMVTFNKSYYDVTSITVSVKSSREPIDAIFSFNDVPNPTEFYVFAYDFAGQRVTKQVEWKARGII